MTTLKHKFATHFIAIFSLLTGTSGLFSYANAATSVKASVNGMVCAFCAQGIEKRLSQLPATQAVFVDLKRKVVVVEVKPGQTLDPKTITHEITEAGYDVTRLETVSQSVAEIKAATQAEAQAKK